MAEDAKSHEKLVNRFIALANNMKHEGAKPPFVSDAFMSACAVYVTYSLAGNEGGLNETGIKKLGAVFEDRLRSVQEAKKAQLQQGASKKAVKGQPAND